MRRPIRMSDIMTAPSEQNDTPAPPAPAATQPRSRRWLAWTILAVLAIVGVILTFFPLESLAPGGEDKDQSQRRSRVEVIATPAARNPGYLGPQACAPC